MHPKVTIFIVISSMLVLCIGGSPRKCSAQPDLCSPCTGTASSGEVLTTPVPETDATKIKELKTDIKEFKKGLQYLLAKLSNISSMLHMTVATENDALDFSLIRNTLLGTRKLKRLRLRGSRIQKQIHGAYAKIAAIVTTMKLASCVETSLMDKPYHQIYTEALHVLCKLSKINKRLLGKPIKGKICKRRDRAGYLTGTKQIDFINQVVERSKLVVKELITKWLNCRLKIKSKGKKLRLAFKSKGNKNKKKSKNNRKGRRKPKHQKKSEN